MDNLSLQILVVEDNLADVFLLRDALDQVPTITFVLTHVERLDAGMECLDARSFDAVLLDLGLPDSQGLETLSQMQARHPGVPIMVLSGLDDENLAVRAVQGGAQDYLVKGKINGTMIALTIRYAIERKRSEQKLMASEVSYRRLFETAQDGIFILDAETGQITDTNPFIEALLGYTSSEFVGKRLWEIGPFRDKAASQAAFHTLREKGYIRYENLPLMTRNGTPVEVEFVSNVYAVGNKHVIQCNIRDITERKRAEAIEQEAQRFNQSTLDALESHVAVLDGDGRIIAANKAWGQFWEQNGGTAESCEIGASYLKVCDQATGTWAEEAPLFAQGIRQVMAGQQQLFCLEYPCHSPREERWFSASVTRFAGDGPLRVVVAHTNITTRKQAEESLRHSEASLAKSQQMAHLGSWELDLSNLEEINANPLRWSDEIFRMLGYAPGEFKPTNAAFFRSVHPDDRENLSRVMAEAVSGGKPYSVEHRIILPDGGERIVHAEAEMVYGASGQPLKIVGLGQDITERKLAEAALYEREEFERTLLENFPNGSVNVFDRDLRYVLAAGRGLEQSGIAPGELVGKSLYDLFSPEQVALVKPLYEEALSGQTVEFVLPLHEQFYNICAAPLFDRNGEVFNIIVVAQEITERRQAEEALEKSEREQRELAQQLEKEKKRLVEAQAVAKVGSWELDFSTNVLNWSDENYRIFGVDRSKFGATYEAFLERIHPDDRAAVNQAYTESVTNGTTYAVDHRLQMEDGSVKFVHERCNTIYDDLKRPVRSVGTSQDITERKQAEEAVEAKSREIVTIWESMTDAFFNVDTQWCFTKVNPRAAEAWQINAEELVGKNIWEQFPEAVGSKFYEEYHRAVEDQVTVNFEGLYSPSNKWREVRAYPSSAGLSVYFHDITERKQAEAQLVFQKTLLEAQSEASLDGILVVSGEGKILTHNQRFLRMWDVPHHIVADGEDAPLLQAVLSKIADPQTFLEKVKHLYDYRDEQSHDEISLLDGRIFDRYSAPITTATGMYYGRVWYFRDITERKQTETLLRGSRKRLALAAGSAQIGIWDWDVVANKMVWDAQMVAIYGVSMDDFSGAYGA